MQVLNGGRGARAQICRVSPTRPRDYREQRRVSMVSCPALPSFLPSFLFVGPRQQQQRRYERESRRLAKKKNQILVQ